MLSGSQQKGAPSSKWVRNRILTFSSMKLPTCEVRRSRGYQLSSVLHCALELLQTCLSSVEDCLARLSENWMSTGWHSGRLYVPVVTYFFLLLVGREADAIRDLSYAP